MGRTSTAYRDDTLSEAAADRKAFAGGSGDICVGTLVEYVEALGGDLEIRAVFSDRQVLISHFAEVLR